MAWPEFMHLKLIDMPDNIIEHDKLWLKAASDGYVHACIQKGMYGLPQAGIIAIQLLKAQLVAEGYHQSTSFPGL
eukprot:CCRYP_020362-RA/>CCRYP_020362-RA protein AED:0.27 eAED:0.27 QI:0/-1/0/1/-1/0/1/0/74